MAGPNDDFNARVIAEFRANGGVCGGNFEGMPMVLVTHRGAKSGVERTTPLVHSTTDASTDGRPAGDVVIIASMGGAPSNPAWYHNLVANPDVTVEVGTDTYRARAREAHGDERQRLFDQQAERMPFFHDYAAKTSRVIPVFVLERLAG
ncbi:MAG: nitroreductase family deazaflavin-dependent oxidoreductase [Acidimicrobiales bacterium]|nr:nitroreductase family deazaflavin-dependent oxidoreductase [Acidimicrobiales bacterium]MCB9392451.1 nitroreductase family deazaflavin-dependent oxidoreductase [Acidimicrobiaceae bacterium]